VTFCLLVTFCPADNVNPSPAELGLLEMIAELKEGGGSAED
jgi:hypothetical protein